MSFHAAKRAFYIPAPNWDIPADSDLVVLGRLIKDPKNPERAIPGSAHIPLQPQRIYPGEKRGFSYVSDQLKSGKIGIWAKALQVVGGGLDLSQTKAYLDIHEFETLETKYFVPDVDYIAKAMQDEGVQGFLHATHKREPIYLITGLKIARGAKVTNKTHLQRTVAGEVKVDATTFGAPVEVGPEASLGLRTSALTSFAGSTDYIFAYRLERIKIKKRTDEITSKEYIKGAMFGRDGDDSDDEDEFVADEFTEIDGVEEDEYEVVPADENNVTSA